MGRRRDGDHRRAASAGRRWTPGELRRLARLTAAFGVAGLTLAAAGCGSDKSTANAGAAPAGMDAALHAKLPASIQKSGVVRVASELDYAPVEYLAPDGKTPIGAEIEVGQAIAKKLGVTFKFTNLAFDPTIPAIMAGRFDTSMTYIGDKPEREQQVDFVDEFRSGYSVMVKKGDPAKIGSLAGLCGHSVSTQVSAANTVVVQDQDKACRKAGKPGIKMVNTQDAAAAILALKSGQVEAHMEDAPVAADIAAKSGGGNDFQVVGKQVTIRNHGMIFKKGNTQLRDAIQAALKSVIADGTYARILKKYKVENISLTTAPINDPSVTP
jgi:polar amino acid transport system substrate-binding protein